MRPLHRSCIVGIIAFGLLLLPAAAEQPEPAHRPVATPEVAVAPKPSQNPLLPPTESKQPEPEFDHFPFNACTLIPLDEIREITGSQQWFETKHGKPTTNVAEARYAPTGISGIDLPGDYSCKLNDSGKPHDVTVTFRMGVMEHGSFPELQKRLEAKNTDTNGVFSARPFRVSNKSPLARDFQDAFVMYSERRGHRSYYELALLTRHNQIVTIYWGGNGNSGTGMLEHLMHRALITLNGERYDYGK